MQRSGFEHYWSGHISRLSVWEAKMKLRLILLTVKDIPPERLHII